MQNLVCSFFQLKVKRKQKFQVRREFQHFEYDMNETLVAIKQLIFKNKKSHVKKLNSFQHFVNITTNSKSPAIKFFKTGLMYAYINIKIKAK
jgi:hypothetical protein